MSHRSALSAGSITYAEWLWAPDLISLGLAFLGHDTGIATSTLQSHCEGKQKYLAILP